MEPASTLVPVSTTMSALLRFTALRRRHAVVLLVGAPSELSS